MNDRVNQELLRTAASAPLVTLEGEQLVTTTLKIAAGTGNQHKNVLELVRTYLDDLQEFGRVAFLTLPFDTAGGVQNREYAELNEEQAALLLAYMRNSEIVRQFKKALIRGFFDMRTKLRAAPADPLDILPPGQRALIALLVEQAAIKNAQVKLENIQANQQESIKRIEAKQSAIENGVSYFTVIGYGSYKGIKFSNSDAAAMGRKASALSKAAGIPTEKVRDPRFGEVGSYHESMLEQALTALYGGM